jgi:hypothetical protein
VRELARRAPCEQAELPCQQAADKPGPAPVLAVLGPVTRHLSRSRRYVTGDVMSDARGDVMLSRMSAFPLAAQAPALLSRHAPLAVPSPVLSRPPSARPCKRRGCLEPRRAQRLALPSLPPSRFPPVLRHGRRADRGASRYDAPRSITTRSVDRWAATFLVIS